MTLEDQPVLRGRAVPSPSHLLLADIADDTSGPDATPLVRFLAVCAMHRPKTLRQADVEQLAEVMIRRGQRLRDRKAGMERQAGVVSIVYTGQDDRPQHRMPRAATLSEIMVAAE